MERKVRNWLLLGIAVSLIFVMWLVYDMAYQPSGSSREDVLSSDKSDLVDRVEDVEISISENNEEKIEKSTKNLAKLVGDRVAKVVTMAARRNLPIKMYGKVIDQYGKPVVGAKVTMDIAGGGAFASATGRTFFTTDASGMFYVQASGQQIQISDVIHPKVSAYYTRHSDDGRIMRGKFLRAVDQFGKEQNWRNYNTPDNPFVLNVWRVDKYEKLKKGSGFVPFTNGEPFELGGMEVSCVREDKDSDKHWSEQEGGWSITFRPIDGGIQETDELYLNEAPSDGYQPELIVAMERGDPDYIAHVKTPRRYYYTAYNGKYYGAFEVIFEPFMMNDRCVVDGKVKYNTAASRNLAVKPRY